MAVAGDATINTLRGDERVARLTGQPVVFGFTWDGARVTVGQAKLVGPRVAEVVRLVLDDGTALRVTEGQLAVHRSGVVGSPLEMDLSLMPLYRGRTKHGYPTYSDPGETWKTAPAPCDRRRIRQVARMVQEWSSKERLALGNYVRHIDGDKLNCLPTNLRVEGSPHQNRKHKLVRLLEASTMRFPRNHRVVGFHPLGEESVFDIECIGCENLAVGGIFLSPAVNHGAS